MSERPEQRINDFLDRMDPIERATFLSSTGDDQALKDELGRQQAVDDSLRRLFTNPRLGDLADRITSAMASIKPADEVRPKRLPFLRGLAVAALLALAIGGLWYSWSSTRPDESLDIYRPQPWRSFGTVYQDLVRNGFQPDWICRTEKQFETAFARRFRQPLLLATLPSGVTAGGISYSNTLSESTMTVLGRVDGSPILIFVDKVDVDHGPPPPPPENLHLFRREVDKLVLYELTPLNRPSVLPYFYNPAKTPGQ